MRGDGDGDGKHVGEGVVLLVDQSVVCRSGVLVLGAVMRPVAGESRLAGAREGK